MTKENSFTKLKTSRNIYSQQNLIYANHRNGKVDTYIKWKYERKHKEKHNL